MKLWDKGIKCDKLIEKFTVGDDYLLDKRLVKYDCKASIAHAHSLQASDLLNKEETACLVKELKSVMADDSFEIKEEQEDCHTAIEEHLTKICGDAGKKIHLGRSRNDQVLTALRLYEKDAITDIIGLVEELKLSIKQATAENGDIPIPGYTHMRKAMPTDIKTWLGSFKESAEDDLSMLKSALAVLDKSPLGTAAGFGVPVFQIDREQSANEMGFAGLIVNPLYAQLSRGKLDSFLMSALTSIMLDLNRLASDLILFSMTEFSYLSLDESHCTGSSIMPQKNNPDVLELIRANYHVVMAEEFKVKSIAAGLISGYNRDMQLSKGPLFNAIDITMNSLVVMSHVINGIRVNKAACERAMTPELFATKKAYLRVKGGMPFRDAYRASR